MSHTYSKIIGILTLFLAMTGESLDNKRNQKIVYFDKETIGNLLQQNFGGSLSVSESSDSRASFATNGNVSASTSINLSVPFAARVKFLFSGRISAFYIKQTSSLISVTSTDISQFEEIRDGLELFKSKNLYNIKNSLTSFRLAASYANVLAGGVDNINTKELVALLNETEGYNLYGIDEENYVRFNAKAFVSNYRINDVLHSTLDLYCIKVGIFRKSEFDYIRQITEMQDLFEIDQYSNQTIGDVFPPAAPAAPKTDFQLASSDDLVTLHDVICAYISQEQQ